MKSIILSFVAFLALAHFAFPQNTKSDNLKYLGQTPPGTVPEKFAPNLISKEGEYEFGSVFNMDATEFFYAVNVNRKSEIRYSKLVGNTWSDPKTILVHD